LLNHSPRLATNPKIYQIIQHSIGGVTNNIWDLIIKSSPRPHWRFLRRLHKRQRALLAMAMWFEAYAREGHKMATRLEVLRGTSFLWARKVSRSSYSKTSDGIRHGRLGNCATFWLESAGRSPLQSEFGTQRHSYIFCLNEQIARTSLHLNENVQCAVVVWMMQRMIRASGKDKLNVYCDKCLNRYGDCAET
jgi:hypothetical protein